MRTHARVMLTVLSLAAATLASSTPACAQEDDRALVVVTLPYLGDVARAVGGEHVTVEVLGPAGQDPHFVVPTPARAVVLGRADAFVETGLQLELWSERVLDLARNQQVRPGSVGHAYAATGIKPLGVPGNQTRAAGDIHPGGNPHVWLDPLNLRHVAANVERVLAAVRPARAADFARNREAFARRLEEAYYGPELLRVLGVSLLDRLRQSGRLLEFLASKQYQGQPLRALAGGWLGRALALEGMTLISYHQVWVYFQDAFGLRVVGTIEDKPGIPPSPAHLEHLQQVAAAEKTRVVVAAPFYPLSRAEGVAERIGGVAVVLPTQPGEAETKDLFDVFDTILSRLEQARAERTE